MLVDPYPDIAFAIEAPYPELEPMYRAVAPAMGSMYRWSDGYLEQAGTLGTWARLQRSAAVYIIARASGRQSPGLSPMVLSGDEGAGIPAWVWGVGGIAAIGMFIVSRRAR
jgi:hypothetical protein